MHNYCVILAGGGSQFWPVARESKPKAFLSPVPGGETLIQQTYRRALKLFPADKILIVSPARYRDLILEQFPSIPRENLLLEPYGRGTATSIAFAAYTLLARDPEALMAITPSDHIIRDSEPFYDTIRKAVSYASENDTLLTLGIIPLNPNINFGYVQVEGGREAYSKGVPVKAKTFTEKPSAELAKVFVDSGEFLWNSGVFIWKASAIRDEMHSCCPEITNLWKGWQKVLGSPNEQQFIERVFSDSPNTSIDYAVLEKSRNLWVLPSEFEWYDVDSFAGYYEFIPKKDAEGNATQFVEGKLFLKESTGNIVYSRSAGKLVAIRGLRNFVVFDTDDVLLIAPRDEDVLQDTFRELSGPEYEEYR